MPKLDATALVIFLGPTASTLCGRYPEVRDYISAHAQELPFSVIKVFPHDDDPEVLNWPLSIASPRGRRSYMVRRQPETGKIYIRPD